MERRLGVACLESAKASQVRVDLYVDMLHIKGGPGAGCEKRTLGGVVVGHGWAHDRKG